MTAVPSMAIAPFTHRERQEARRPAVAPERGWSVYLLLAVCLVPVSTPVGPAQMAVVDVVNALAVVVFLFMTLARWGRIEVPFLLPVFLIGTGSLIAAVNSESAGQSFVTLLQDTYLYLWFVVLVNVMRSRNDLLTPRLTWLVAACVMALLGLSDLLTQEGGSLERIVSSRGNRAFATFLGPNPFAHFLVLSAFVGLSLQGRIHGLLLWPCVTLLLLAVVATKSTGATVALLGGLVVWAVVRALTRRVPALVVVSVTLVVTGVGIAGWWVGKEYDLVTKPIRALQRKTYIGKFERSSHSRFQIWDNLVRRYSHSPLGIGPGNSRMVPLTIPERVRRNSFLSKEAHNDYLAYLFERGPMALLGLLVLIAQAFLLLGSSWRRARDAVWKAGAGSVFVAALAGGLVATSLHSIVIEKLHFRVFWLFLAMLYAFREPEPWSVGVREPASPGAADPVGCSVPNPMRLT